MSRIYSGESQDEWEHITCPEDCLPKRRFEPEYDAYLDEHFGERDTAPIDFPVGVRVYLDKLAKGWPPTMAAVAARKAKESIA